MRSTAHGVQVSWSYAGQNELGTSSSGLMMTWPAYRTMTHPGGRSRNGLIGGYSHGTARHTSWHRHLNDQPTNELIHHTTASSGHGTAERLMMTHDDNQYLIININRQVFQGRPAER